MSDERYTMKGATAYERGGVLYLNPSSLTTVGVWIATEPFLTVDPESTVAILANSPLRC